MNVSPSFKRKVKKNVRIWRGLALYDFLREIYSRHGRSYVARCTIFGRPIVRRSRLWCTSQRGTLINRRVNIFPDPDKLHARCAPTLVAHGVADSACLESEKFHAPPLKTLVANATKIGRVTRGSNRGMYLHLPVFARQRWLRRFRKKKRERERETERKKGVATWCHCCPVKVRSETIGNDLTTPLLPCNKIHGDA